MPVKDQEDARAALARGLDEVSGELTAVRERLSRMQDVLAEIQESPGVTVRELAARLSISEEAILAFAQTAGELAGERGLDAGTARRAALIAVSAQVWEDELGPLLTSAQVRDMLGSVSRQRVDELLRSQRLIGLRDGDGRRRFPAFQFAEGQRLDQLIEAFWVVAQGAISEWTAAAWCVAADEALGGRTPAAWARSGEDPERLAQVARQDAARLAR